MGEEEGGGSRVACWASIRTRARLADQVARAVCLEEQPRRAEGRGAESSGRLLLLLLHGVTLESLLDLLHLRI